MTSSRLGLVLLALVASVHAVTLRGSPADSKIFSTFDADGSESYMIDQEHPLADLKAFELHDLTQAFADREHRRRLSQGDDALGDTIQLSVLGRTLDISVSKFDDLFSPNYKHVMMDKSGKEVSSEKAPDCIYRAASAEHVGAIAFCKQNEMMATLFAPGGDIAIEPVKVRRTLGEEVQIFHAAYYVDDSLREKLLNDEPLKPQPPPQNREVTPIQYSIGTNYTNSPIKYIGVTQINDFAFFNKYTLDTQTRAALVIAGAKAYYDSIPATAVYRVVIALTSMITLVRGDPYTPPFDSNGVLLDQQLLGVLNTWKNTANIQADVVHFLIGIPFSPVAAGWGYIGTACGYSNTAETDGTMGLGSSSRVAAHEIGHVLGMNHDDVVVNTLGYKCSDTYTNTVMGRRLAIVANFTPCALEWVRLKFAPGSSSYNTADYPACAEAPEPAITATSPQCGNGVVDAGEQCDCPYNDCTNVDPCCNGATCQRKAGATCSVTGNGCCNPSTCASPLASGSVCRAQRDSCDLQEVCDGSSVNCPFDDKLPIGTTCETATLRQLGTCTCNGCTSIDYTCKLHDKTYKACGFGTLGDAGCSNSVYCDIDGSGGCTTWFEDVGAGTKCGEGLACDSNKKCVPQEQVMCKWSRTSSPVTPTAPVVSPAPSRPPTLAPASFCGNGIVDPGEQCDCGLFCDQDPCCSALTCQYAPNAQCSAQDSCCNKATCRPASAGTVCREAKDSCDNREVCDGTSKSCPADTKLPLGTSCKTKFSNSDGACDCEGCTSTDDYCKAMSNAYSVCSWKQSGDSACGTKFCFVGTVGSCSYWGDKVALGYKCGASMGCSSSDKCVPLSQITCDWMKTAAPTTPTTFRTLTSKPIAAPTVGTASPVSPTLAPIKAPTLLPTIAPTRGPTNAPTKLPTRQPSESPTKLPTKQPTQGPTRAPTLTPTLAPTQQPTEPTITPPTGEPTTEPPTANPVSPTIATKSPTRFPTRRTRRPTNFPSRKPTAVARG